MIDETYNQKLSLEELNNEFTLFAALDLVVQTILSLNYQGNNISFHNYLASLSSFVSEAYEKYAAAKNQLEEKTHVQKLINTATTYFNTIAVSEPSTSFLSRLSLFSRDTADTDLIAQTNKANEILNRIQI